MVSRKKTTFNHPTQEMKQCLEGFFKDVSTENMKKVSITAIGTRAICITDNQSDTLQLWTNFPKSE